MGVRIRSVGKAIWCQVVLTVALVSIARLLLFEEEEDPGLLGGHQPERDEWANEFSSHKRDYLKDVDEAITAYSRAGLVRRRRFYILTLAALACASAVPVAVAADAPGWAVAVLGAAAAIAQGTEQLLQDQRLSVESHTMAVLLSQELRKLRYNISEISESAQREAFREFVNHVEEIREKQGSVLIDLMRQAPSPAKSLQKPSIAGQRPTQEPEERPLVFGCWPDLLTCRIS